MTDAFAADAFLLILSFLTIQYHEYVKYWQNNIFRKWKTRTFSLDSLPVSLQTTSLGPDYKKLLDDNAKKKRPLPPESFYALLLKSGERRKAQVLARQTCTYKFQWKTQELIFKARLYVRSLETSHAYRPLERTFQVFSIKKKNRIK